MSQKSTKSITFRLDYSIIKELETEAEQQETSLNVLINQVLRRYSEWDRYENKIGMMPVPKVMLSTLIEKAVEIGKQNGLGEKGIKPYRQQIARESAKAALAMMKDSVLLMKKQYNLWTVLGVLQEYMKVSGINSDHKIEAGGKHVFIVQHDLGDNWSAFTSELVKMIFEELANVRANVASTPNTVVAEVVL
jgi:hypothetical protein